MTKDDLIATIRKELKDNPKASGIEIANKHKISFHIVEVFRIKIIREEEGRLKE